MRTKTDRERYEECLRIEAREKRRLDPVAWIGNIIAWIAAGSGLAAFVIWVVGPLPYSDAAITLLVGITLFACLAVMFLSGGGNADTNSN